MYLRRLDEIEPRMNETVSIEIMGEQFTIKCPSDQKANLKAAKMVHEAMKKISDQGTAFGVGRNSCHGSLEYRK